MWYRTGSSAVVVWLALPALLVFWPALLGPAGLGLAMHHQHMQMRGRACRGRGTSPSTQQQPHPPCGFVGWVFETTCPSQLPVPAPVLAGSYQPVSQYPMTCITSWPRRVAPLQLLPAATLWLCGHVTADSAFSQQTGLPSGWHVLLLLSGRRAAAAVEVARQELTGAAGLCLQCTTVCLFTLTERCLRRVACNQAFCALWL